MLPKIIPAILEKDIKEFENKLTKLSGLFDLIQVDIMDGKFVDNSSVSLDDIFKINLINKFSVEAHLMVENPEKYFEKCHNFGVKKVIFHAEIDNLDDILTKSKNLSFQTGLALNPETEISKIQPYINGINLVLLLGVNPGFQGQKFIPSVLDKVKELREINPDIKIEIDGGINLSNISEISKSGADYLVVGSGLFESDNIKERLEKLYGNIS